MPLAKVQKKTVALVALAFSTIFVLTAAVAAWVYSKGPAVDFASFWAAGRLATGGSPALAYDIQTHRAMEMSGAHMGGLMPFPYPPPFLFFVVPMPCSPEIAPPRRDRGWPSRLSRRDRPARRA